MCVCLYPPPALLPTDVKTSLMELHDLGPCKLFDTAGLDEPGELGAKKRAKVGASKGPDGGGAWARVEVCGWSMSMLCVFCPQPVGGGAEAASPPHTLLLRRPQPHRKLSSAGCKAKQCSMPCVCSVSMHVLIAIALAAVLQTPKQPPALPVPVCPQGE